MEKEKQLSAVEASERRMKVAIKSSAHLKQWLQASGRRWLVFNGEHLVDALPWPDGVQALIQMVACYRDHRSTLNTGELQLVENPETGEMLETSLFYPETLTLTEMDRVIRYLVGQITSLDSDWKLENEPL